MAGIGDYEEGKAFKLKSGNKPAFKMVGSTPAKHTTNRSTKMWKDTEDGKRWRVGSHEEKYGKDHDNSAHPDYWKKERGVGKTDKEKELKVTAREKTAERQRARGKKILTPAKHSTNRIYNDENETSTHNEKYGKGHTNKAHPEYWKVKEHTLTTSDLNPDYDRNKDDENHADYDPDYDVDQRINDRDSKYYASDKDKEMQNTRNAKKGLTTEDYYYPEDDTEAPYAGTNTKDRVGKHDGNTYNTPSYKSKSKSKSKSTSKSTSKSYRKKRY
mgnify:CR=1 FL=1